MEGPITPDSHSEILYTTLAMRASSYLLKALARSFWNKSDFLGSCCGG